MQVLGAKLPGTPFPRLTQELESFFNSPLPSSHHLIARFISYEEAI